MFHELFCESGSVRQNRPIRGIIPLSSAERVVTALQSPRSVEMAAMPVRFSFCVGGYDKKLSIYSFVS